MSGDFWSRRRAAVEAEAEEARLVVEEEAQAQQQAALEARPDEEILEELGLPDPDALEEGDDVRGFLAQAVPERLRRRALRRLWRLNPVLANVDGLVDYGEDFTDAACVVENLQTAYQVGRGMTQHVEELARQAELEAEGDAEGLAQDDAPQADKPPSHPEAEAPDALALSDDAAAPADEPEIQTAPAYEFEEAVTDDTAAPPRRMRFHFDEAGVQA